MSKFTLGSLVATRGVADLMGSSPDFEKFVWTCYERYMKCDWGDLDREDAKQNDAAVKSGEDRILAAYVHPSHPDWKIWIITEWDRSATTILFPSEY